MARRTYYQEQNNYYVVLILSDGKLFYSKFVQCFWGYANSFIWIVYVWTDLIQLKQFIPMDKVIRDPYLSLVAVLAVQISAVDWTRLYSQNVIPPLRLRAELQIWAADLIGIQPQMDWNAIKHLKQTRRCKRRKLSSAWMKTSDILKTIWRSRVLGGSYIEPEGLSEAICGRGVRSNLLSLAPQSRRIIRRRVELG